MVQTKSSTDWKHLEKINLLSLVLIEIRMKYALGSHNFWLLNTGTHMLSNWEVLDLIYILYMYMCQCIIPAEINFYKRNLPKCCIEYW